MPFDPEYCAVGKNCSNPYKGDNGMWFWFTEDQDVRGPYETEDLAQAGLDSYAQWLDDGGK